MAIRIFKWAKMTIMTIIYLYLAGFMLFVAIRMYDYSGGLSDIGTIAVVVAMVGLFVLIMRLTIRSLRGTLSKA